MYAMQDITASYNWDNVVTKILPVGKDGIMLNALDETQDIYLYSDIIYVYMDQIWLINTRVNNWELWDLRLY